MRVLLLGSGAKDHAVAWWFSKSCYLSELYVAQGNLATGRFAINLSDVNPQILSLSMKHAGSIK